MPAPTNRYSALWFKLFMPLQSEEATQRDIAFLSRQLPLPRYRRVLDLCCGFGRHALPLAQHGYAVTGVDRDAAAIAEARGRAARATVPITYVVGDLLRLEEIDDRFDAVINMSQSLNYFDEQTNLRVLEQIAQHLSPGGRFIIDMYNRDYFAQHQGDREQEIDGVTVMTRGYLDGDRWHSELSYRDQTRELGGDHMDWQLFTPDEFCALAAGCGFHPLLVCSFADETVTPSAEIPRVQIVFEQRR